LSDAVSSTVIRRIEREETQAQLVSATGFVNRSLREAGIEPDTVNATTRSKLNELVRSYRDRLRVIVAVDSEYIDALTTLDADYTSFVQRLEEYRGYLESLILWIPNHPPLWQIDIGSIGSELAAISDAFADVEVSLGWMLILALGGFALIVYARPKAVVYQTQLNGLIARPRDDSIQHTLLALACVTVRALTIPALILVIGSLFPDHGSAISDDLGKAASRLAVILFVLDGLRLVCEPSGIARLHFGWREATTERTYREIGWLIRWWLPVATVAVFVNRITPDVGDAIIPRTALLTAAVMLVVHLTRNAGWLEAETGERWYQGVVNRLRLVAMALMSLTGLAVVFGLVFSVTVIAVAVVHTVWIGIAILLLHAMLKRWLRVARRRLRMNELLSGQKIELQTAGGETIEIKAAELGDISAETLSLVNVGAIAAMLTALLFIWAPLLPAFQAFGRVTLWTSTTMVDGETIVNQITLATLIVVVLLLSLSLYAARKLPALVELLLRSRTTVSQGGRYATSTLLNYVIVGTGTIAALGALGLQWSQLQWLVAALGVGIGFGLQEIVANFISGLIILFERPIRVGDVVTIGDKDGTVTKIRIRATTLRDWDGKELLVPNKEFITGRLLNWTLSDSQTRLVIPVGIAYGSNVELAMKILMDVISNHPSVLKEPAPSVLYIGFGDSSLNLVARCFVGDMAHRMPTTSDLHDAIDRAFREAGVVIAFPQRDMHMDAVGPIRVSIDDPEKLSSGGRDAASTSAAKRSHE
jgi:potassium efflux system protein